MILTLGTISGPVIFASVRVAQSCENHAPPIHSSVLVINHRFPVSSQATVLELVASPDLLGPPGTQIDVSWSHPETPPQEHRKPPNLTEKYVKQKVVPGLFQSSQATVLELLASPDLLGPPGTQITRRAFTCSLSFNAQRVIRKRGNDDL